MVPSLLSCSVTRTTVGPSHGWMLRLARSPSWRDSSRDAALPAQPLSLGGESVLAAGTAKLDSVGRKNLPSLSSMALMCKYTIPRGTGLRRRVGSLHDAVESWAVRLYLPHPACPLRLRACYFRLDFPAHSLPSHHQILVKSNRPGTSPAPPPTNRIYRYPVSRRPEPPGPSFTLPEAPCPAPSHLPPGSPCR